MLYNNLSGYLREKYGSRLKKICIDGGFSCPNRDGTCGIGGCIFCGERGAGEHIDASASITEQVRSALSCAKDGERFIAYFQNFTNTYADTATLKKRYDAALIDSRIAVLAIGTRPDCITEENAALIAEYRKKCDVWVELGLQTASDSVGELINRGYKTEVFERAAAILKKYSIPTVAHIIVGLPSDSMQGIKETVGFLTRVGIWGLKIHSIYVMRGTHLADMYARGEYTPPSLDEYIDAVTYIISHIDHGTVIHRLTGDCPRDMLIAPDWNLDKHAVINKINAALKERGLRQGILRPEGSP